MKKIIAIFYILIASCRLYPAAEISAEEYANQISYCIVMVYHAMETDIKFPNPHNQHLTIELLEKMLALAQNSTFIPKNDAQKKMIRMGSEFSEELAKHIEFLKSIKNQRLTAGLVRQRGKNTQRMDDITVRLGKFIQQKKRKILE